jgi:DNA-binding response OmpR family regulator
MLASGPLNLLVIAAMPVMRTNGRAPHILTVDDTPETLDLLREILEDEGYRITTSMALLDLDNVKDLAPDAIIQDVLVEHSQELGWKFLTLVRLDPELADVPLILCTAEHAVRDKAMVETLHELGVPLILKPFQADELLAVLGEVLRGRVGASEARVSRHP